MRNICQWAGCVKQWTTKCYYWGSCWRLCTEHAELVGNDDTRKITQHTTQEEGQS